MEQSISSARVARLDEASRSRLPEVSTNRSAAYSVCAHSASTPTAPVLSATS